MEFYFFDCQEVLESLPQADCNQQLPIFYPAVYAVPNKRHRRHQNSFGWLFSLDSAILLAPNLQSCPEALKTSRHASTTTRFAGTLEIRKYYLAEYVD